MLPIKHNIVFKNKPIFTAKNGGMIQPKLMSITKQEFVCHMTVIATIKKIGDSLTIRNHYGIYQ